MPAHYAIKIKDFNNIDRVILRQGLIPVVVSYEIVNDKIVTHWLVADQTILMEQLGVDTMSKKGNE